MNKSIMMGRLVRDPEIRYSETSNGELAIATFRLAVDRKFSREGDPTADFFRCTAFGKRAEFVADYLRQGIKVVVEGRMQNDNYTNRDGERVYSVCLMVDDLDFAESKKTFEERQEQEEQEERNGRREAKSSAARSERSASSARGRNRSEAATRRSEREDDYRDDRDTGRKTERSTQRSATRSTQTRRTQEQRRKLDNEFMEAPDEELDFD